MHNVNDITNMQDTSTQAMTEVALGLSMAFFALLIIALVSVTLPNEDKNGEAKLVVTTAQKRNETIDISEQLELTIENSQSHSHGNRLQTAEAPEQDSILLYWNDQFFTTQGDLVDFSELSANKEFIVAVSPQVSFNQLLAIQTKFSGRQMRLTKLSPQWQASLSQINNENKQNEI